MRSVAEHCLNSRDAKSLLFKGLRPDLSNTEHMISLARIAQLTFNFMHFNVQ